MLDFLAMCGTVSVMFLLTVAPIQRGIPVSELSYVVKTAPPIGALVLVPLRKKEVPALVLAVTDIRDAKAAIKDADFALRKIDSLTIVDTFSPAFIAAAEEIANWSVATLGATIQALFPSILLDTKNLSLATVHESEQSSDATHAIVPPLPSVLQAEEIERIATYKSHIREVFAKNGSVFFILPTVQDIERTDAAIGKGIGTYTYVLHGNLTKKQLRERLAAIKESAHPLLVIATPQFLAVPCANLQSIILERESASAYTMTHRPYIDLRRFVEAYARERRLPLIIGDLFLRVETLARFERGELDASSRPKGRYSSVAHTHIVDMRESGEQPAAGRIAFFSRELVSLIKDTRKRSATTFILCVRRGVSPMTVCGDCGTVVECEHCKAPLVLHHKSTKNKSIATDAVEPTETLSEEMTPLNDTQPLPESMPAPRELNTDESSALGTTLPHPDFPGDTKEDSSPKAENIFICHRCGDKSAPKHKCAHCGGWRLTPLGLGIAQAEEILRSRFPDAPIYRLDTDSTTTHKQAQERAQEFLHTPGAILLGTEMALPYLTDPIGLIGVLSVNSLLTIPEFRMTEHVFRLLLVLREKARDHFLIQTREANPIFTLAAEGNIGEFLRSELELRKELSFPPYTTLVKVSHIGDRNEGLEFAAKLNAELSELGISNVVLPGFITKQANKVVLHSLIVMRREAWPHDALRAYLASLPPSISIRVDPKSIVNE